MGDRPSDSTFPLSAKGKLGSLSLNWWSEQSGNRGYLFNPLVLPSTHVPIQYTEIGRLDSLSFSF